MSTDRHAHTLNMVILYDSIGAGKRAKELCDRVVAGLGAAYTLNCHCWNLSMLQSPVAAQFVARETTQSPCLMVAVNANVTLARPLEAVLGQCARAMRSAGTALVAQLHGIPKENEEHAPAYRRLKQIAANAGIPFFSEVIETAADDPHCTMAVSPKIIPFPNQLSATRNRGRYAQTEATATSR